MAAIAHGIADEWKSSRGHIYTRNADAPTPQTTIMASGTVIVTGANGGLGNAFAQKLLSTAYHGIFTVRAHTPQSSGTLKKILASTSMSHAIVPLDLGSLTAVRAFADDVNSKVSSGKIPKIRALVLNAAQQTFHGVQYTSGGIETTFGINYLANFLLVLLLLKSVDPEGGKSLPFPVGLTIRHFT